MTPSSNCMTLFLITLVLAAYGCRQDSPDAGEKIEEKSQTFLFEDTSVPVYGSAQEQLAYAYSLSAGSSLQQIAFRFVADRFSANRPVCARALLQLAYIELGADYRLANENICRRTLKRYAAIAKTYADLPAVRARALWYMGWIHTDLLKETDRGVAIFRQLAGEYMNETPTPEEPTPRVSFIYPEARKQMGPSEHGSSWPALAMLEIIKNDTSADNRFITISELLEREPESRATGLGLLVLLKKFPPDKDIIKLARTYIHGKTVSPALEKDIRNRLIELNNNKKQDG